jgi:hypothetical protein
VKVREKQVRATLAGLSGIGPKDELEGMLAAQLVTASQRGKGCYRRATHVVAWRYV